MATPKYLDRQAAIENRALRPGKRGVRTVTRVAFNPKVLEALEEAVYLGLYDAAVEGRERMQDFAFQKYKTARRFQTRSFAAGFDETGDRFAAVGRAPEHIDSRDAGQPVSYFGVDWYVARFAEIGTAHQPARPFVSPAGAEITERLPGYLRKSAQRRGFR